MAEKTTGILEKIIAVQEKLKAPKNQYNSFGKYHYRSCEDILECVKPLCAKNGLLLTISDSIKQVGDRYYVCAEVLVTDAVSGESKSVTAYAREVESKKGMDESQVTGSVSSYARKYALNGMFCIDDTKDSDFSNKHDNQPACEKTKTNHTTTDKRQYLMAIANKAKAKSRINDLPLLIKKHFEVDSSANLTLDQCKYLYDNIDELLDNMPVS
jgi:hypothetical protein